MDEQASPVITNSTIEKSESIAALAAALAKAQSEIRSAAKTSDNPFFKSKYADLAAVWDACREPLTKNGLSVIQLPGAVGSAVSLTTVLAHASGEWISGRLTIVAKDDGAQAIGGAITYARRYALAAIAGIAQDDDDGNTATGKATQAAPVGATIAESFRQFGVTITMLEKKLGYSLADITEDGKSDLRKIYDALKSGKPVTDFFSGSSAAQPPATPPTPVAPPPVDHTPAQPTDEPRPGEKRGRGRPKKDAPVSLRPPNLEQPVEKQAGTVENPVEADPPVEQPAQETSSVSNGPVHKADEPATDEYRRQIREKLGVYINKLGADPLKTWMLKFVGAESTQKMKREQWEAALARLEELDRQGGTALTDIIGKA